MFRRNVQSLSAKRDVMSVTNDQMVMLDRAVTIVKSKCVTHNVVCSRFCASYTLIINCRTLVVTQRKVRDDDFVGNPIRLKQL